MTITEVYKRFINTIIDKYGDASIEDFEFTELFNRSALAVLKDQFNNTHKRGAEGLLPYAFEMSQTDLHRWQSLIQPVDINTDINGKVLVSDIETALGGKLFHINTPMILVDGEYRLAKYVRHNDYARFVDNHFLKPTIKKPTWRGFDGYIQINPVGIRNLRFTITRYPRRVVLDFNTPSNNVDSDLSDNAIADVLLRMEQYFAIQIREPQLYQGADAQENKQ